MRGGKRKCRRKNSHTLNDVVQNRPRPLVERCKTDRLPDGLVQKTAG